MQVLTSSLTQTQLTLNCDALAFMQSTKKVTLHLKKKKWYELKLFSFGWTLKQIQGCCVFYFKFFDHVRIYSIYYEINLNLVPSIEWLSRIIYIYIYIFFFFFNKYNPARSFYTLNQIEINFIIYALNSNMSKNLK